MHKLTALGFGPDVSGVEIVMKQGAKLENNFGIKDGYLISTLTGKRIELDDFPLIFVKVLEI